MQIKLLSFSQMAKFCMDNLMDSLCHPVQVLNQDREKIRFAEFTKITLAFISKMSWEINILAGIT